MTYTTTDYQHFRKMQRLRKPIAFEHPQKERIGTRKPGYNICNYSWGRWSTYTTNYEFAQWSGSRKPDTILDRRVWGRR